MRYRNIVHLIVPDIGAFTQQGSGMWWCFFNLCLCLYCCCRISMVQLLTDSGKVARLYDVTTPGHMVLPESQSALL
ncbi:hypothetical protein DNTS_005164, partial [Danionella cerebrum]